MSSNTYDCIIIGGGPSGMMAAIEASKRGLKVLILEKNARLGEKLLITGGGRCNVTNNELDTRKLLAKFKDNNKFLFSSFSQYAVKDALNFFHLNSLDTKEENEKRVFPITEKAESVWQVLVDNLKKNKVEVLSNSAVEKIIFDKEKKKVLGVRLKNKKEVSANNVIVATGGTSHPETGSTGDAYPWLRELGHSVVEPTPSLVPIKAKERWVKDLAGVSLLTKATVYQNNKKQAEIKGKVLFTHVGLSGPAILNLSSEIGELLKYGEVKIKLDLMSTHDHGELNIHLQRLFAVNNKKKIKNVLNELLETSLANKVLELAKIDLEKTASNISREERMKIIEVIKNFILEVEGLLGLDKAVIVSGGVVLEEVDFRTMQSKLYSNLYLVGDILNIDRPSGGYSLQLCWTTGFVAGSSVK